METKVNRTFGAFLICLVVYLLVTPVQVSAETRHILQKYAFTTQGILANELIADFGSGQKKILVEKKELSETISLLLFAFAEDEDDVFALQLFNSRNYSIYKTNLRGKNHDEVVILGLGAISGKRVQLREIFIIAEDEAGVTQAMPVKGFTPVNVLNAPMQLDINNNILLPTQVGEKILRIAWSDANSEFVVTEGGVAVVASQNITKDESVFEE